MHRKGWAFSTLPFKCRQLLGQLQAVVRDAGKSPREVAAAVRGIGELAPPTLRFFGQQVGRFIFKLKTSPEGIQHERRPQVRDSHESLL